MDNFFFSRDIRGDTIMLDAEESRHALQVLRYDIGDELTVVDGQGGWYRGQILNKSSRGCAVRIHERRQDFGVRTFRLCLGIAPPKSMDRFEWFLEKAVEIGVDIIAPICCEHSQRRLLRPERTRKIIIAAMKQSQRAYLPEVCPMVPFSKLLATSVPGQRFIANGGAARHLKDNYSPGQDVTILVGPEGDFSPEEIAQAQAASYEPVSLGPARLRTETAGIVSCIIVNLLNE
jgi:16S rRNA (uracil1498-N3)-methyltransferase